MSASGPCSGRVWGRGAGAAATQHTRGLAKAAWRKAARNGGKFLVCNVLTNPADLQWAGVGHHGGAGAAIEELKTFMS